jgi:hypothetical protein
MSSLLSSIFSAAPPSGMEIPAVGEKGEEQPKEDEVELLTGDEQEPERVTESAAENVETAIVMPRMAKRSSVREMIDKLQPFTLAFDRLTVHVPGVAGCCACSCGPLQHYATEYMGWSVEKTDPFYALNDVSGYVQTGEMLLVLGSDPQYSSTLIQALTGRLNGDTDTSGTVTFNGSNLFYSSTTELQGWRRITAHVSANDGSHAPVLTVEETFRFAAECTARNTEKEKIDDMVRSFLYRM